MSKRRAFIDVESYYGDGTSVREMCMVNYLRKSYPYVLSVVTNDGFRWAGTPDEFRRSPHAMGIVKDPDYEPWAVNSNFDQQWLEWILPDLARCGKTWRCVSDLSVSHQRPRSLENMTRTLTGVQMDKGYRGQMKNVHWCEILSFEQDRIKELNLIDSDAARVAVEKLEAIGPMSSMEQRIAAHTRMLVRRGIACDLPFIEKCRQALEWVKHLSAKGMPWVAEGKTPLSAHEFNTFCCKFGVAPPDNLRKDDGDFTAWMAANPSLAPYLKARQNFELANRKLSHIDKFLSRVHEGIYYPDLLYCGAPHTRRFSAKGSSDGGDGGDELHSGFNVQNMDRDPIFGDLLPDFFSPLPPNDKHGRPKPGIYFRNFLVPRPGKCFIILDQRQIEPRALRWLAGDTAFLDLVRSGYSIYEAHARYAFKWEGHNLQVENDQLYRMCKAGEIGLGYGCGVDKYPSVALKMAGLVVQPSRSAELVYGYRNNNPKIPDFWKKNSKAIESAFMENEPLKIVMPNGEPYYRFNVERYARVNLDGTTRWAYRGDKVLGDPNPKNTQDIYGGKVTENLTQRVGRDVLAGGNVEVEDAGIPVILHAHDEMIAEVDIGSAREALETAKRIMETVPEWAEGLPVAVAGGIFARYTKA